MRCKKVQSLLPLLAGDEIPLVKVTAVKAHLGKCSCCQQEYQSCMRAIEKTKEWLAEDRKDWEESQWQRAVQKAVSKVKPEVSPLAPWPFKKGWAYALVAVLVTALGLLFVIRPSFIQDEMTSGPGMEASSQLQVFQRLAERPEQDIISMTMVSRESGLKIVWILNRNFDLEVKQ